MEQHIAAATTIMSMEAQKFGVDPEQFREVVADRPSSESEQHGHDA